MSAASWVRTVLGLGMGEGHAVVAALVWAAAAVGCGAWFWIAKRARGDWQDRQLERAALLPLLPAAERFCSAELLRPAVRLPIWVLPYAQLLALGPFDAQLPWAAPGAEGWLAATARVCRALLLAEPTGPWGPAGAEIKMQVRCSRASPPLAAAESAAWLLRTRRWTSGSSGSACSSSHCCSCTRCA